MTTFAFEYMRNSKTVVVLLAAIFFLYAELTLAQTGTSVPNADTSGTVVSGQSYAMIIGISTYKHIRPLSYADSDAGLFREYLQSAGAGSIPDDRMLYLINEEATAANFWVKGMAWLRQKNLKEGDLVFFNTVSASMIITHVGVYVCNNKFVHASTSKGVTINDLSEKYFAKAFRGAGRFINP